jgi:hypothetical protein
VDPPELDSVSVAVTFTCGGMYCVFRLLLGMSSSSSDHSPSASPNGFGFACAPMTGEAVPVLTDETSSCTTSAEGQVNFSERRVESRTSVATAQSARHVSMTVRIGWADGAPGERVAMSTCLINAHSWMQQSGRASQYQVISNAASRYGAVSSRQRSRELLVVCGVRRESRLSCNAMAWDAKAPKILGWWMRRSSHIDTPQAKRRCDLRCQPRCTEESPDESADQ